MEQKYKISKNWDCIHSIEKLKKDCEFVYNTKGHHGNRPHLKLDSQKYEFDVVIISNDKHGIIVNAISKFNKNTDVSFITDFSKNVDDFIVDYLTRTNAIDLLN